MNKFLRRRFQDSLRSGVIWKATLLKNTVTVLVILASVLWLLIWGIDLFFASSSLPYVKIATVIIGYGVPMTNIYYNHKELLRRVRSHRLLRESRQQAQNA